MVHSCLKRIYNIFIYNLFWDFRVYVINSQFWQGHVFMSLLFSFLFTYLFSITLFNNSVFASTNSNPRQAKALLKLQAIQLPKNLSRQIVSPKETISPTCSQQNEKILSIDPNFKSEMTINLKSYYAEHAQRTIIILPPTGGVNSLDYNYAKEFCKAGFNSIILLSWTDDTKLFLDPKMHDQNTLR